MVISFPRGSNGMLNLDTHILIYALADSLKGEERELLGNSRWGISAIVIWELTKLFQLGRISLDPGNPRFRGVLSGIHMWPVTLDVCLAVYILDIKSDPADEIICATSINYDAPLVTRDRKLRKSKVVPLAPV